MAFPVVETTNESSLNTAGTSHVVSLPSGVQPSNLILVLLDKGSTAATFNTLSGWSELVDENAGNGITIWYRWADGTEGATVTFTSTASTRSAHTTYRISGAQDPGVQAPELSTVATGTSANPNATTCTPTGGAKDYLWITMFGQAGEQADDDSLTTVTPTGFTNPIEKTCGTAGTNLGGMIASAEQQLNAASVDASAWTSSDTTAWRAYTIAVHPGVTGAGAETQDNQTSSASGTVSDPSFIVATRTSQNTTDSTSQVVTLPDGSNVSGRLVVVVAGVDGNTGGVAWPSGWSEIFDDTTTDAELAVGYRIIDGTEGFDGTDDTITLTTGSEQSNTHAYLIQGAHASQAPEAAAAVLGGTGEHPDPPNIDPSGWGTEESLWIAAAGTRFNKSFTAAPTNYTNLLAQSGGDANTPLGTAHRVLSAASENPGAFTTSDTDGVWIATTIAIRPAGSGIAGTVAETQDAQTSSASGQLGYSGNSAQTQADQTSSASGTVTGTGVDGTVAATQAAQTSTASGVLGYTGTSARTQANQTSTATGVLGYSGTAARTQAAQTSTAAGILGYSGTVARTQADQTSTASGTVGGIGEVTGTLAETQDAQTSAAAGQLGSSGVVAASQANQTATGAGWITITGAVAEIQDSQTASAAGNLGATGTLARTQANQTLTATGWITVTGLVARTQANQTCAATGFVGVIPIPSGRPLNVPAGSHAVTASASQHAVTVPAGTHVVEVS